MYAIDEPPRLPVNDRTGPRSSKIRAGIREDTYKNRETFEFLPSHFEELLSSPSGPRRTNETCFATWLSIGYVKNIVIARSCNKMA